MDFGVKNKWALVGGASKGLGLASSRALAAEGCHLVMVARNYEQVKEAAAAIAQECAVTCLPIALDLAQPESNSVLFKKLKEHQIEDQIQILVNNIGGPPPKDCLSPQLEDWQRGFEQLFCSATLLSQKLAIPMKQIGWGRIITVTSLSVFEPAEMLSISTAMRAAVSAYMKSLSNELAPFGITVNTVVPGVIKTDRIVELRQARANRLGSSLDEEITKTTKTIPMGRLGCPEELGSAVAFLASQQASYITGQNLVIDGGLRKSW